MEILSFLMFFKIRFTPSSQKEIFSVGILNNRHYTENFERFIRKSLGNTEFFGHFTMKFLIPFIDQG